MDNVPHIGERIKIVLMDKGMTAAALAKQLEVSQAGLSGILNGRNNPDFNFIAKFISHFADVNRDWLILGLGSPYNNPDLYILSEPGARYYSNSSKSISQNSIFFQADYIIKSLLQELDDVKLRLTKLEST